MNYQKISTVKKSYVEGVWNCQKNAKEGSMKETEFKKQTNNRQKMLECSKGLFKLNLVDPIL